MRFTETVRNQRRRVVVIGAGPAGAAADALSRGGYDVTVLEADHLGGRTHTPSRWSACRYGRGLHHQLLQTHMASCRAHWF